MDSATDRFASNVFESLGEMYRITMDVLDAKERLRSATELTSVYPFRQFGQNRFRGFVGSLRLGCDSVMSGPLRKVIHNRQWGVEPTLISGGSQ